jgi:hypothetical protein
MMKHLTSAKKKKIAAALPADADIRWERIDDAIDMYMNMLDFADEIPSGKGQKKEAKEIQALAFSAYRAIDELERSLSTSNYPIKQDAETSGLRPALEKVLFTLAPWTSRAIGIPKGKSGPREKVDRYWFITFLSIIFKEVTGETATLSHDAYEKSKPYGPFFDFVMACAGDLKGFKEVSEQTIGSAIYQALNKGLADK